jgi:hypothetical protein
MKKGVPAQRQAGESFNREAFGQRWSAAGRLKCLRHPCSPSAYRIAIQADSQRLRLP